MELEPDPWEALGPHHRTPLRAVSDNNPLLRRLKQDERIAMILGIEAILFIVGLITLIKGEMPTNDRSAYVIQGLPARMIGVIMLLPIPLTCVARLIWVTVQGEPIGYWMAIALEAICIALCIASVISLRLRYRTVNPRYSQDGQGKDSH